jgi:hypothetical protein
MTVKSRVLPGRSSAQHREVKAFYTPERRYVLNGTPLPRGHRTRVGGYISVPPRETVRSDNKEVRHLPVRAQQHARPNVARPTAPVA